ncbi:hypothetical protein TW65_71817 [Stemphylium lycopersici]|nr:hypothetical protein TW65_71817 [Stemphylium lycopersici]
MSSSLASMFSVFFSFHNCTAVGKLCMAYSVEDEVEPWRNRGYYERLAGLQQTGATKADSLGEKYSELAAQHLAILIHSEENNIQQSTTRSCLPTKVICKRHNHSKYSRYQLLEKINPINAAQPLPRNFADTPIPSQGEARNLLKGKNPLTREPDQKPFAEPDRIKAYDERIRAINKEHEKLFEDIRIMTEEVKMRQR